MQERTTASNELNEGTPGHSLHPKPKDCNSDRLQDADAALSDDTSDLQHSDTDPTCKQGGSDNTMQLSRVFREATGFTSKPESELDCQPESSDDPSRSTSPSHLETAQGTDIGQQADEASYLVDSVESVIHLDEKRTSQRMTRHLDDRIPSGSADRSPSPNEAQGTAPTLRQPPAQGSATREDLECHLREERRAVLDDLRGDLCRRLKLRKRSGIMSDTVFQKQVRSSFWTADMLYHRWGKDLLDM